MRPVLPLLVVLPVLAAGLAGAASADAAKVKKPTATKTRCAPGSYPVVKLSKKKLKPRRDGRGRLRCVTTRAKSRPVAPATSATRRLGQVADGLDTALELVPGARRTLDRRLGKRRTTALLALGLSGWRRSAGAATAPRAYASGPTSTTFGSEADGTAGKVSYGVEETTGDKLGIKAQADAEVSISRDGLEKILDKDKLPADLKSAKAALSVSFEDAPQACPSAAGKLPGRLHGKASITITTTSTSGATTTMRLSADADMSYKVSVGEDGHWTTIDDVDMRTEFQASGTGQTTQTYRGRRLGGGFGRESILGGSGSDFGKALDRDWGKIDAQKGGGVFGPKGAWNWKRGVTLNDLHSIDNVKAMVGTWIATDALLLAGVEYLRAVALKRGEKYWYDDEQCMALTGTATPASLRPKGIATVTASKAKAKDGGDVPAKLTATGTASIDPGAADLALGGTRDFKLTAPDRGAATWTVIGISRAGKKTVSGSVPVADDLPLSFSGTIASTFTTTGLDQAWDTTATYTLASRQDNPDGSVLGLYTLTNQATSTTENLDSGVCGTYRFTGSPGAIVAGDLELQIAADGTRTYGFLLDVGFTNAVHSHVGPTPMGCPASSVGLVKAFLNSRTLANSLRAVAPDGRLVQATTSDLFVNASPITQTTGSWTLSPG